MNGSIPNDPRFTRGSGFLETICIGTVIGGVFGYFSAWETISVSTGSGFIFSPGTLYQVIRHVGIFPHSYIIPLGVGAAVGLALGALAGYKIGDVPAEIHIRGRKLTYSTREAARALRPARKAALGVAIHPAIGISEQQEVRHIMLLGGSGSGKTSILWPVINQAVERGDRCLIFSFKGDFQQKAEFPFSLLAPWDSRSVRWQLGKDIRTRLHAESLAKTLIQTPDKDPIWAQGAQGLLTAIISEVQSKYGENWGFFRLAQACSIALSDYDSLVQTVMNESPLARSFLMGKDSKTTASYLAQMASNLSDVVNLGVADFSNKGRPWCVRDWLAGKTPGAAILGYMSESEELSQAFCSSIIEQAVKQVLGFSDADPDQRRIWLFLDEVPQAGKIPSITSALEAARSKGCRVVLGMQGVAQLEEHGYSKNTLDIWSGQCGIKIIANLSTPRDQKWAADLLGERDLERYQSNISVQNSGNGGNSGQSGGYQRTNESVMLGASFGTDLFVDEGKGGGPMALIVTSKVAAVIKWPFPSLRNARAAFVEAPWIMPRFVRPVWGKVPPEVGLPPPLSNDELKTRVKKSAPVTASFPLPVLANEEEKATAAAPRESGSGSVATDLMTDRIVEEMLNQAIMPGVGALFDGVKTFSEASASAGGSAAISPIPMRRHVEDAEETKEEDEDEAG